MRAHRSFLALALIAAPPACTAQAVEPPHAAHAQQPAPAAIDNPMSGFARLVGGEWRVTFASGEVATQAWEWGPGQRSMRRLAYGITGSTDAATNPWAGEVLYWHPGLGEVRVLSMHEDIPGVGRGVGGGKMSFDGETSEAFIDLEQPRGVRKLGQRQIFDGPDRYHELLLEDGGAGYQPLNALDFVRFTESTAAPAGSSEPTSVELPERWKAFQPLVGSTWETDGHPFGAGTSRIRSTFEWLPALEVVFARAHALNDDGAATLLLDAWIYRPVRNDSLRCLALSQQGGVYEGDVSVLDGGALQLELKLSEDDRVARQIARFELDSDGRLRTRVWTLDGAERTPVLDVEFGKVEP